MTINLKSDNELKKYLRKFNYADNVVINFNRYIWKVIQSLDLTFGYDRVEILAIQYNGDNTKEILKTCLSHAFINRIDFKDSSLILESVDGHYLNVVIYDGNYFDAVRVAVN